MRAGPSPVPANAQTEKRLTVEWASGEILNACGGLLLGSPRSEASNMSAIVPPTTITNDIWECQARADLMGVSHRRTGGAGGCSKASDEAKDNDSRDIRRQGSRNERNHEQNGRRRIHGISTECFSAQSYVVNRPLTTLRVTCGYSRPGCQDQGCKSETQGKPVKSQ